jgi:hypothetical protein
MEPAQVGFVAIYSLAAIAIFSLSLVRREHVYLD